MSEIITPNIMYRRLFCMFAASFHAEEYHQTGNTSMQNGCVIFYASNDKSYYHQRRNSRIHSVTQSQSHFCRNASAAV